MRLLVTCEHATGAVPDGVELGVGPDVLDSHVSYDRGAALVARALAAATGAPLHLGACSRLVVDLNRREDNPDVIVAQSYGIAIPGNEGLDDAAREARIARWHRPYREAARVDAVAASGSEHCLHLAIHAFEPAVDPPARTFDVGVLFDPSRAPERGLAAALRDHLAAAGWDARLNEPYHGVPEGLTSWLRGQLAPSAYSGMEIECSYAWVDDPARVAAMARDLAAFTRAPQPMS